MSVCLSVCLSVLSLVCHLDCLTWRPWLFADVIIAVVNWVKSGLIWEHGGSSETAIWQKHRRWWRIRLQAKGLGPICQWKTLNWFIWLSFFFWTLLNLWIWFQNNGYTLVLVVFPTNTFCNCRSWYYCHWIHDSFAQPIHHSQLHFGIHNKRFFVMNKTFCCFGLWLLFGPEMLASFWLL